METLSFENANIECQKILWPLKAQNTPLDEYIKACLHVGSEPYKANLLAMALKDTLKQNKTNCYNCGKFGYFRKDCRKDRLIRREEEKKPPPSVCPRCKKGKHWANECRSKWDKDG